MFFPANFIDILIILFLVFSLYDGWRRGLLALLADLVALALSILLALQIYTFLAPFLSRLLNMPEQAGKVLSFFIIAFALGTLLSFLFNLNLKLIPTTIRGSLPDKIAGTVVGLVKGFVYAGIVLLLLTSLPVIKPLKDVVAGSRYAPPITARTKVVAVATERFLKNTFGGLIEDTFALLTIKPGEGGLNLGFKVTNVRVDEEAEQEMLQLLNSERVQAGLVPLRMDPALREVARAHSRDMFERGYFSHETPEGTTPAERLDEAGIDYSGMGENLALAPDVELAHNGLMRSPSHRENILFPDYRNVGIGAINGGIYGIMFSQEFTY